MRLSPALAVLGFAALCAASSALAAGEVYKWTDDTGVVQYTDSPPDGRPFEKIVSSAPRAATPVAAEAEAAPESAPLTDPEAVSATAAPGTAESNCEIARKNIVSIETSTEVRMDRNGDGTSEVLTPDERTTELARNQSLAEIYCPKAQDGAEG